MVYKDADPSSAIPKHFLSHLSQLCPPIPCRPCPQAGLPAPCPVCTSKSRSPRCISLFPPSCFPYGEPEAPPVYTCSCIIEEPSQWAPSTLGLLLPHHRTKCATTSPSLPRLVAWRRFSSSWQSVLAQALVPLPRWLSLGTSCSPDG